MTTQNPEHMIEDATAGFVYRAWIASNGMAYIFTLKRGPGFHMPAEDPLHRHALEIMRSAPLVYLVPDIGLESIFAATADWPADAQGIVWFFQRNTGSQSLELFGNSGVKREATQARLAQAFYGTLVK